MIISEHHTSKLVTLCNSIPKYVVGIWNTSLSAYHGASIFTITAQNKPYFSKFDNYIVHVGIHNINNTSAEDIKALYYYSIAMVEKYFPEVLLVISSIIPQPVDYEVTKNICIKVGAEIKLLCYKMKYQFAEHTTSFYTKDF